METSLVCGEGNAVKTLRLIGLGIVPLILGFIWDRLILHGALFLAGAVVGLVLLLLWGYAAYKLSDPAKNPVLQALLMCAFGLLMLLLVLYQELVRGAYWMNCIGMATQLFFLPMLGFGYWLLGPLDYIEGYIGAFWHEGIVIWLAMLIASWVGCFMRQRKNRPV